VDDESDIVNIFKQGLEDKGLQVTVFSRSRAALDYFRRNYQSCVLVISDIKMPWMDGYDLVSRIKEIKPAIRVFFVTAFDFEHKEIERILPHLIIDEFIKKPVSLKELYSLVSKYLNGK
jgi:response regulator RpfG family c-di-GMP phosphodiesterase